MIIFLSAENNIIQIGCDHSGNQLKRRTYWYGTWNDWDQITLNSDFHVHKKEYAYNGITISIAYNQVVAQVMLGGRATSPISSGTKIISGLSPSPASSMETIISDAANKVIGTLLIQQNGDAYIYNADFQSGAWVRGGIIYLI